MLLSSSYHHVDGSDAAPAYPQAHGPGLVIPQDPRAVGRKALDRIRGGMAVIIPPYLYDGQLRSHRIQELVAG